MGKFVCGECSKTYSSRQTFSEHRIKIHKIRLKTLAPNWTCLQDTCKFSCTNSKSLREHLKTNHKIECNCTKLKFFTVEDFREWKKNEEKRTTSRFVSAHGCRETEREKVHIFKCNRSGSYITKVKESNRKRALKAQGSVKCNTKCLAQITASIDKENQSVTVLYYSTHYGHKMSVAHIPISEDTKTLIAAKLQLGITASQIITDLTSLSQPSSTSAASCTREALISKKDINNVKRSFNIKGIQRHDEDHKSVDILIKELKEMDGFRVFYKPMGQIMEDTPNIFKSDFIFVIQTDFQVKIFSQLGCEGICIGSTHETNQYDFKLITVLCVDEWGEEIPALWCISNKETTEVLKILFKFLKEGSQDNNLNPKFFMSDDACCFFTAFKSVYTESTTVKLLCSWHVLRAWQRALLEKIKDKEIIDEVYNELKLLLHTQSQHEFDALFALFQKKISSSKSTEDFARYFTENYANRVTEWAGWSRKENIINTNMYDEALDKQLNNKEDALQGQQNKRLDSLIDVLLKLDGYYMTDRVKKIEKGKPTKRLHMINSRHQNMLKMDLEEYKIVQISNDQWSFPKQKFTIMKKQCPREVCKLLCTICKICIHSYVCSCGDSLYEKTICKHIHFMKSQNLKSDQQMNELSDGMHTLIDDWEMNEYSDNIDTLTDEAPNDCDNRNS